MPYTGGRHGLHAAGHSTHAKACRACRPGQQAAPPPSRQLQAPARTPRPARTATARRGRWAARPAPASQPASQPASLAHEQPPHPPLCSPPPPPKKSFLPLRLLASSSREARRWAGGQQQAGGASKGHPRHPAVQVLATPDHWNWSGVRPARCPASGNAQPAFAGGQWLETTPAAGGFGFPGANNYNVKPARADRAWGGPATVEGRGRLSKNRGELLERKPDWRKGSPKGSLD